MKKPNFSWWSGGLVKDWNNAKSYLSAMFPTEFTRDEHGRPYASIKVDNTEIRHFVDDNIAPLAQRARSVAFELAQDGKWRLIAIYDDAKCRFIELRERKQD